MLMGWPDDDDDDDFVNKISSKFGDDFTHNLLSITQMYYSQIMARRDDDDHLKL